MEIEKLKPQFKLDTVPLFSSDNVLNEDCVQHIKIIAYAADRGLTLENVME